MSSSTGRIIALSALAALLWGPLAWSAEDEIARARPGVIEEVFSTATRRAEPLQETPVAVTVITAEQIDMTYSANIAAMPFLAPNVNISNGLLSNQATPAIRGYTLTDVDSTFDPPVATMVNGRYGRGEGSHTSAGVRSSSASWERSSLYSRRKPSKRACCERWLRAGGRTVSAFSVRCMRS